jgi:hypothetical protein
LFDILIRPDFMCSFLISIIETESQAVYTGDGFSRNGKALIYKICIKGGIGGSHGTESKRYWRGKREVNLFMQWM